MAANHTYRSNGSAAIDVYATRFDQNAAVQLPNELPVEHSEPKKKAKVRAKVTIAPFAAVGMAVVVFLLAMVINGYVQLYEASSAVGELNAQLSEVQTENAKLRSNYESKIDLQQIEAQAKEMGMHQPTGKQTVYLNIAGADSAEVLAVDNRSLLVRTWEAVRDSFTGIVEYFR